MMLLLDIGNTRLKWARLQEGRLSFGAPVVHREQPLSSVWSALWDGLPVPQRMVVGCVAGDDVKASLANWCHAHWGLQPEFVVATAEACGVRNGYLNPSQLGVDRWLTLIGARNLPELTGQSACLVGCGTALTVDVLVADGRHLGGWIAPGLVLMSQQLVFGAAVFASGIESAPSDGMFGRGTAEAVTAGISQAAAGLVMQAQSLAQRLLGLPPICVLTGGDAEKLLPLLPSGARIIPDLVLHGLATVALQEGAR